MNWRDLWRLLKRPVSTPRKRYLNAAAFNRLTEDWLAPILSANQAVEGDIRTLRGRARKLARDNPHAAAAVRLLQDNVIGEQGMMLQANVMFPSSGQLRKPLNDELEAQWRLFGQPGVFSVDGRLSCADFQRLALANAWVDGELLIRHRRGYANGWGYAVQLLDPDQLDEQYNRAATATDNEIRMGVELDGDNRAVAFYLIESHPSEPGAKGLRRVRVPATDLVHVFIADRPGQVRGISRMTPSMYRLYMLEGFQENALVASRIAAASPIVYEQNPDVYQDATSDPVDGQRLEEEVEPGLNKLLPPGVTAKMLTPNHPSITFTEFEKAMLRAIAAGWGLAYTSLTGDLREANYGSQRGGLLAERDAWRSVQRWFAEQVMLPIYREWVQYAYLAGRINLPTADRDRYANATFEGRGWDWIDPKSDLDAAERAIKLGLDNRTRLCKARGADFDENVRLLQEEQQTAEAADVAIDGVQQGEVKNGSENADAANAPANDAAGPSDRRLAVA